MQKYQYGIIIQIQSAILVNVIMVGTTKQTVPVTNKFKS